LGLAIAERFAVEGFAAYPLSRSPERLSSRIAALRARGLTVRPLDCDLADSAAIDIALQHVRERHGFCDVLVYNAFGAGAAEALECDAETLIDDLRVNLGGALELVRKTLDGMRSAGAGAMLFTGCSAAASAVSLGSGQACLRALVDDLVPKLRESGIRAGIVTVSPAIVDDARYVRRAAQAYWDMFITSERAYRHEVRVEC
jgi:NADP-dependent 3-hydroxy acid dehydrogenase YdfG